MLRVSIIGATGYGGVELIRLLRSHPQVELTCLTSESYAGRRLGEVYPHLGDGGPVLEPLDPETVAARCDLAMLALPAGKSLQVVPRLLEQGKRVIDVSPDFRLKDPACYPQWYGFPHPHPQLLAQSVYGLPELWRQEIRSAQLVAAPGCYPTGALLPLAPLLRAGLIEADSIIIDSKSGVSGAGRTSLSLPYHFPEADEDVSAYQVASHRHTPEIEQEAGRLVGREIRVTFTPHLVPMSRGIFTTIYASLANGADTGKIAAALRQFCAGEPFLRLLEGELLPHTKWAWATNFAYLAFRVDARTGRVVLLSAIDNLGKGMAGQMVQCLNLMCGWEETLGLQGAGPYP